MNLLICASVTTKAGAIRIVVGLAALTKTPASRMAVAISEAFKLSSSIPINKPAPKKGYY